MIEVALRTVADWDRFRARAADASRRSLFRAAGLVRTIARHSIRRRKKGIASSPGSPPYTHTGRIKNAIRFDVESSSLAVIGSAASVIGPAGGAHEQGGAFRDEVFPKRPFMGPALTLAGPTLPDEWAGRIA